MHSTEKRRMPIGNTARWGTAFAGARQGLNDWFYCHCGKIPWPRQLTKECVGAYSLREGSSSGWRTTSSSSSHGDGPGSWALASSLKEEQRQHTGSGIRPHDLKPAFSSDILSLVRLYLQNLPKEGPQTIQTSEPTDTVSFKSLHGHFLIFKWYLFSLTPINRLSAWFPTPSYMLLVVDGLVRGKWHLDVFKICFSVLMCEWQVLTSVKWTNSCSLGRAHGSERMLYRVRFERNLRNTLCLIPPPADNTLTMCTHSQTDLTQGKKGIVPVYSSQGLSSMQNKEWSWMKYQQSSE